MLIGNWRWANCLHLRMLVGSFWRGSKTRDDESINPMKWFANSSSSRGGIQEGRLDDFIVKSLFTIAVAAKSIRMHHKQTLGIGRGGEDVKSFGAWNSIWLPTYESNQRMTNFAVWVTYFAETACHYTRYVLLDNFALWRILLITVVAKDGWMDDVSSRMCGWNIDFRWSADVCVVVDCMLVAIKHESSNR